MADIMADYNKARGLRADSPSPLTHPPLPPEGGWGSSEWVHGPECGEESVPTLEELLAVRPTDLIVTRHKGLVAWLATRGIEAPVVAHALPADVRNKHVVGVLPLSLAALCKSVTAVDLPGLRPDQRGKDLSPSELDEAGAHLVIYEVKRVSH